jgi:hypothetical protein
MKQATLSLKKILPTVLLLCGISSCVWSMEKGSSYNYDIGENWETGSLDSRGFSDVASSSDHSRNNFNNFLYFFIV